MIKRLAIIGVGLIGGSLALALKKAAVVGEIVGYSRSATVRDQALALGIIDRAASNAGEAVVGADMIFLAVPMSAMSKVLAEIADFINEECIITDGGSSKAQLVSAAKTLLGDKFSRFVPGHPIAGTEKSGPSAAFAELYQDHHIILTPVAETDVAALAKVTLMWQHTGAVVTNMEVTQHDQVLAATSHVPHILAFNLLAMLAKRADCDDVLRYAAGGFKDFSRIAASDPVMWRDICLSNKDAILTALAAYQNDLTGLAQAIEQQDGVALITLFERAKQVRERRFS